MNCIRRRNTTIACTCEPEFEPGLIRGAAVKYNDSRALRLRRRAVLQWQPGAPSKVLIIKKPKNPAASAKMHEIGTWLKARGLQVFVERVVWATEFKEFEVFDPSVNRDAIDFCITLGGDGTVLYMTSLFEEDEPLPPTLCFAMGSLGFLTPFDAASCVPTLERVLDTSRQPLSCTLRTRKRCEVVADGRLEAVHHVLNECVVDRGAFPGAVLLEIFADGAYVTNVEADGLIISTPSGSTAYSMSAGGPIVAPSVPCTVLTPIAPLSLSFRPLVIPESSSLCIHLPTCARAHARASFDGRRPMRIRRGTSIFFTASLCPLPIISLGRMDTDWYEGITSKLKWNQAIRQLPSCPSPAFARQQAARSRAAEQASAQAGIAGERAGTTAGALLSSAAEGCTIVNSSPRSGRPAPTPAPATAAAAAAAALAAAGEDGAEVRGLVSRASTAFGSQNDGCSAGCSVDGADGDLGGESYDDDDGAYGDGGGGSDGDDCYGAEASLPTTPRCAADGNGNGTAPVPADAEAEAAGLLMERAGSLGQAVEAAQAAKEAKRRAHIAAALRRPGDGNGAGGPDDADAEASEPALYGRPRSLR